MTQLGLIDVPDGALLRVEQVAAVLGLEVGSVRRLIRNGAIPARHIGRRWFVLGRELKFSGVGLGGAVAADVLPLAVEPSPSAVKRRKARAKGKGAK